MFSKKKEISVQPDDVKAAAIEKIGEIAEKAVEKISKVTTAAVEGCEEKTAAAEEAAADTAVSGDEACECACDEPETETCCAAGGKHRALGAAVIAGAAVFTATAAILYKIFFKSGK